MTDLVINPVLKKQINAYIANPSHALLISGKVSSGKKTLVHYMAESIKHSSPYSKLLYIYPLEDKRTIGIDQVKQLKKSLRTKDESYRIIVIPDIDKMTIEAQNSFLKLLEEPPKRVLFLVTSSNEYNLLPTVRSRLLKIRYITPTQQQLQSYVKRLDATEANRLLAIADGRMGLLSALAKGDRTHSMLQAIELAKEVLSETAIERLVRVDVLSKDASLTQPFFDALLITCNAALQTSVRNDREYGRWIQRLDAVVTADKQLAHNVLAKLVLTRLFLVL